MRQEDHYDLDEEDHYDLEANLGNRELKISVDTE